jgi:hypothetical protein
MRHFSALWQRRFIGNLIRLLRLLPGLASLFAGATAQ